MPAVMCYYRCYVVFAGDGALYVIPTTAARGGEQIVPPQMMFLFKVAKNMKIV